MKYECDLVQDLLPLYQDEVCSDASKKIVEEHLKECESCKKVAGRLKNYEVDEQLKKEKDSVLAVHEKKERRKTVTVGMITAGILMIPVIVCLICNLALGHALDWFFIVLAALLMVASVTVLPLMVSEKRLLWTILGFTASLLLLLLVCCIYTGGNWFFVAAVSCIFGLSVVFGPYVGAKLPLTGFMDRNRGLLVMLWDSAWLYLLIIICGIFVKGGAFYWRLSLAITFYGLLFPWSIFLIVRYLKCNAFLKTGISVAVEGVLFALVNDVVRLLSGETNGQSLRYLDLSQGLSTENYYVLNANLCFLILVTSVIVGAVFCIIGLAEGKAEKKK